MCWGILVCVGLASTRAVQAVEERDLEPLPPVIIFPRPDPHTGDEIGRYVKQLPSTNKFPETELVLVRRYHLWSLGLLNDEVRIEGTGNLERRLVSLLTLLAMRQEHGPHQLLGESLGHIQSCCDADGQDPWAIALAALASGGWRWTEGTQEWNPDRRVEDRMGGRGPERAWRANVRDSSMLLARRALAPDERGNWQIRTAALLAMAKRGGARLRTTLAEADVARNAKAHSQVREADLVARAFLGVGDLTRYEDLLLDRDPEEVMQRGAGVALGVALLAEPRVDWTSRTEQLEALLARAHRKRLSRIAADEVVFAKGVLAWRGQFPWDRVWNELFQIATASTSGRELATAAAQALIFCQDPRAVRRMSRRADRKRGRKLEPSVLKAFLLRCGMSGEAEHFEPSLQWIVDRSIRPVPRPDDDPRFHAVIGICRTLTRETQPDLALRQRIIDALIACHEKVLHPEAPFRQALGDMLEGEGQALRSDPARLLSRQALERLEDSYDCPDGLLGHDILDMCAHRVNEWMFEVLELTQVESGRVPGEKGKGPQRYLAYHLKQFPYFRRQDFFEARGARRPLAYDATQPGVIDR